SAHASIVRRRSRRRRASRMCASEAARSAAVFVGSRGVKPDGVCGLLLADPAGGGVTAVAGAVGAADGAGDVDGVVDADEAAGAVGTGGFSWVAGVWFGGFFGGFAGAGFLWPNASPGMANAPRSRIRRRRRT